MKLTDDEVLTLETLIQSPAYSLMLKVVNIDREKTLSELATQKDPVAIYRLQGRIAGANVIKNLPVMIVQHSRREALKDEKKKKVKES